MHSEQRDWPVSMFGSTRPLVPLRKALLVGVSAAVLTLFAAGTPARAQQLPTGGSVASGTATIGTPQNGTLTINQSTDKAILNWQSFSIGQGGTVNFNQPNASSATLNRVLGSTPSSIAGTINAPGTVLLVNPNGIAITKDGVIKTGSFAASTLDIKDSDFLNGNYKFTGNGASAAVTNAGRINVSDGGFAALLGGQVANSGVIAARLGKVGLGAGELITLDLAGDGFLSVAVPSTQLGNLVDANGALVTNSGKIRAKGGTVFLSAATASNILRDAVNVPGSIRANSVGMHNGRIAIGRIVINGGSGRVNVSGRLAANGGRKHKAKGGSIAVAGASVNVTGKVSANGTAGGTVSVTGSGNVSLSGALTAKGASGQGGAVDLTGANVTLLGALIDASGAGQGATGGHVAIIAADTASIDATIKAEGGDGGHGGLVETSGAHLHVADRTRISTLAVNGASGTWLIDPNDFTIAASGADISGATLSQNLAGGDVTILSSDGHTAGTGDIFVNDAVTWSSGHTLTLNAVDSIAVNANIKIDGAGSLDLIAGGALAINAPIAITGAGTVALTAAYDTTTVPGASLLELSFGNGGSIDYGATDHGGALSINGAAYTLLYSMSDVQAINASDASLSGNYALATSLDASSISGWSPIGVEPCGCASNSGLGFSGSFEGLNHTISNLTVAADFSVGLFGYSSGTLRDVGMVGGSATGVIDVGALAAVNGGIVANAYSTGDVSGFAWAGGLIGESSGVVTNSYSSSLVTGAAVSGSGAGFIGGLIGVVDAGTVINSHASGNVIAVDGTYIGGLIGGTNVGVTVINTYATGNVYAPQTTNGGAAVGGLIGDSYDAVTDSFATGNVTGEQFVGGLIGFAENNSVVTRSFATGSVTGDANSIYLGGLIGYNNGISVTDAYAMGAVIGGDRLGGLIGGNEGEVTNVYATGFVGGVAGAAPTSMGALVAENYYIVDNGYWNSETSGQSSAIGIDGGVSTTTGQTTAELQGTLPSGFDSAVWGTGSGLYPYLKTFFPNGVQAVSGVAYKDARGTVAASGSAGAVTVSLDAGGARLGQATTGANGYYYFALPNRTLTNGEDLLVTTPADGSASANAGTLAASAGAMAQTEVNLYGNILTDTTSATLLSGAPLRATIVADATAAGSDAADTIVAATTGTGYIATGAGFTIDQSVTTSGGFLVQTASGAPLTVAAPIAIGDGGGVGLLSGGALAINALMTAEGAASVALAYDASSPANLSFAPGAGLTFLKADGSAATMSQGGSLTVNGQSFTLLYSMADLDGIDAAAAIAGGTFTDQTAAGGTSGRYALAGSLDASGTTYTDALVAGSFASAFTGTFEGLGHTITGLTVNKSGDVAGLFGWVAGGTVRDIGLVGGAVSGGSYVGGLVGDTSSGSAIIQAYATGDVSGTNDVGGLVGVNSGTITKAYATGTIRGMARPVYNYGEIGGLVGLNAGTITQAYTTGAVIGVSGTSYVGGLVGHNFGGTITQSYATGSVYASNFVGGLVGFNDSGTIAQSYATGAVSGSIDVGGLVGLNTGTINQAYATGDVSGSGATFGGLAGLNTGTITNGYYDSGTTGQAHGIGSDYGHQSVSGLTTAQFQSGALPTGFDNSVWSIGSGLYPYLTSFFPGGVQAITGTAFNGNGTAASGAQVGIYSGGALLTGGTASVGANGYFYELVAAGTLPATNAKVGDTLTLAGATGVSGLTYTDAGTATGNVFALGTLSSGLNKQTTAEATYSGLQTDLGATFGSATYASLTTALASTPTSITATGADFALDTSLTPGAAFTVAAHGDLSVDQAISAGNAAVVLTSGSNLTIGRGASVTSTASNNAVVLAAGANFINNAGAGAVQTRNGRWLIYSAASDSDTFGDLDSGNTAIWNTAYPAPVSATGDRYVFAYQPTLTITSTGSLTKVYGDDATAAVAASSFTISGLENGVANAFLGDTAATVYSGAPVFTSAGSGAGANASDTPYSIDGATGSLRSLDGYAIAFVNNGTLTVGPAPNDPGSHANPRTVNTPNPDVGITFQNPTSGPVTISVTPVHVASNPPAGNGNDVTPAALPVGRALATNNGFVYLPISQFDANQYSQFKLPDYAAQAGEATVFAMIARGADAQHAADDLIDTFWNGTSGAWASANAALMGKVTFSDGAGNTVAPTGHPGFPIVAGTTDLAQMLKSGPVMIGDAGTPVHWLLATQMTADGKGIVANDPATGKQVVLGYDPAGKTVGGVTGVFDTNTKTYVSLANALANPPAEARLSPLQSFVPAEFLSVTVK
jgi:filamentous hemagglutinin family protein